MCRFCKTDEDASKYHVSCDLCSRSTRKSETTSKTGPLSGKSYTVCPDCTNGLNMRGM